MLLQELGRSQTVHRLHVGSVKEFTERHRHTCKCTCGRGGRPLSWEGGRGATRDSAVELPRRSATSLDHYHSRASGNDGRERRGGSDAGDGGDGNSNGDAGGGGGGGGGGDGRRDHIISVSVSPRASTAEPSSVRSSARASLGSASSFQGGAPPGDSYKGGVGRDRTASGVREGGQGDEEEEDANAMTITERSRPSTTGNMGARNGRDGGGWGGGGGGEGRERGGGRGGRERGGASPPPTYTTRGDSASHIGTMRPMTAPTGHGGGGGGGGSAPGVDRLCRAVPMMTLFGSGGQFYEKRARLFVQQRAVGYGGGGPPPPHLSYPVPPQAERKSGVPTDGGGRAGRAGSTLLKRRSKCGLMGATGRTPTSRRGSSRSIPGRGRFTGPGGGGRSRGQSGQSGQSGRD